MVVEIQLTRGLVAIVDEVDADLNAYNWCAKPVMRKSGGFYAARATRKGGVRRAIFLHRAIMTPPAGMVVDHVNGNGLDNRRSNLRLATIRQNVINRRTLQASGFRGVYAHKCNAFPWRARIQVDGKVVYLGTFQDPATAARAYDEAAREHFGEFACLNFPEVEVLS